MRVDTKYTAKTKRTNTGFEYVSYFKSYDQKGYIATQMGGRRKKFYINKERTREQAFMEAMKFANKSPW